jgi:hypothetical protein
MNYYVDCKHGKDTNDGLSGGSAYKTIHKAMGYVRTKKVFFGKLIALLMLFLLVIMLADAILNRDHPSVYDINQDGHVDQTDGDLLMFVYLEEYQATPAMIERCDVNHDGFVTDLDVALIVGELRGE